MPEFPSSGPVKLEVKLVAGSVELIAEERQSAVVEITPYDDSDASREAVEQTRVEFTGDTLSITGPDASGFAFRWNSTRIRVRATVPTGSSGRLKSASADLACRGEWGQFQLGTASGDATFDRTTGDLVVNTASGDVRVGQVGGQLSLKSASGDITIGRVGGAVDIKTASGDVQLDEAGADVSVKTAAGNVRIGAASNGTAQTTTVSGDVSVGVRSGTRVWLDLNSLTGHTRSNLSLDDGQESTPTGHQLTVRARAVSGNVDVHRVVGSAH